MKTARQNKFSYVWVVQGNYGYGHGWEDLCESDARKEALENLREYRANESGYPHRMIHRRVLCETAP